MDPVFLVFLYSVPIYLPQCPDKMFFIFILMFGSSCEVSYTPTPIPLTDSYNESPLLDMTTTRSNPENHLQLPYFGHLTSTETVQPQSSITDVVFLPGQVESGFQPMTGKMIPPSDDYPSYPGYEGEVRRHDGPQSYHHQPRYSPRPIRGPASQWRSPGRNNYRSQAEFYKYNSDRNHQTPLSYGRPSSGSRPRMRTEYRDSHFYRSQPESLNYQQNDKPEATRHISYYNDDISDIENSVLRETIYGETLY